MAVIPPAPTIVSVSFVLSAAMVVCPLTAMLPNAFAPTEVFVNVIVSDPAAVVMERPVPAASVNVSDELSATTSD